jgi:uncharacterized coiled-coil protein SlyX
MDERRYTNRTEIEGATPAPHATRWLVVAIVGLIAMVGLALGYGYEQKQASSGVTSDDAGMTATISQMQGQVDSLNAKLNEVTTTPPATLAIPAPDTAKAKQRTAAQNKRIKELQSQLADQQQQLKDTQDQVAQTRTDLEGSVNSTRDELNGSIARTHDELVALEQKGERNYVEFDLVKAKHFLPAAGVALSLRKADPKHKTYDLAMVVNDDQLSKKHVNLYEPIWIMDSDQQQVQVVVNKIDKDRVHGYVSAPKYRQSAGLTPPASADSAGASNTSNGTAAAQPATSQPAVDQSVPYTGSSESSTPASSPTTQLPQ